MKVATIIGTRPELIKLSATINKLDKFFDHTIIHTGQNYDYQLNEIFYDDLGIRKPDLFLECVGDDLGITIGNIISKSYEVLKKLNPDSLLIYGDTNSCLSVLSAKRLKIPVFHMEAGNRCFDQRVPEELNRKIVDHLSDVNLTISEHARNYLLREGLNPHLSTHLELDEKNGIYCTTGSLGHGFPIATGRALAKKLQNKPGKIFVMVSDGECQEGTTWETLLVGAKHKLEVVVEDNVGNTNTLNATFYKKQ